MNIVDIAAGSDNFNLLVRALTTAQLDQTVRDATDITVFAPNDAAFGQLAVDLGFTGDVTDEDAVFDAIVGALTELSGDNNPIPLLQSVLTYHVSPGAKDAAAVTAAASIATLEGNAIAPDVPLLRDLEPDVADPALVSLDIPADNGIIHEIDRVLLPLDVPGNDAPSIAGLVAASGDGPDADNSDFDLLLAAVQTAGLTGALAAEGADLTVFAPTDAAFIALAQDLGFTGTDEAGALNAIVATLTALGGGDPIPLLTAILTYHVSPGAKQLAEVAALTDVATLQGGTFGVSGTMLVDNEPDLTDPSLVATDIQASNGIVHAIDRVLIPADIPASDGSMDVNVLLGTQGRDRLDGGADNDLLIGGGGRDLYLGGAGMDIFVLGADAADKVIDFDETADTLDVSAWGATSFDDLAFFQRGTGSVIVAAHGNRAIVQAADGTIDVSDLTADTFVFASSAPAGTTLSGTEGRDLLEGTLGDDVLDGLAGRDIYIGDAGADTFVLGTDAADKVIDFVETEDRLDVSAWGVGGLGDLEILARSAGSLFVKGNGSIAIIQAEDGAIATGDLTEEMFLFV